MGKFVFVRGGSIWWPVKWLEPIDGGGTVEQSLEMKFKRVPWPDVEALYQLDNEKFITAVATDWKDIIDAEKRPVPFEVDAIAEMAGRPAFAEAIGGAFMKCMRALPETRQGNFDPSLAGGSAAGAATAPAPVADGATAPATV